MKFNWKVINDLFPNELLEKIEAEREKTPLLYGWPSCPGDPYGHWNHSFAGTGRWNEAECSHLLPPLLRECWELLREGAMALNPVLLRCYLNGYTYGTEGYVHTDSDQTDCTTMVVYLCNAWHPDWAGETVLFD